MQIKKELLSPEEKVILADFVNSEYWPVYRKVQDNAIANIERMAITSENMEELNYHKGRIYQIKVEKADFTRNFTKVDTEKRKKQAKARKEVEDAV